MMRALEKGNIEMARLLLDNGVDASAVDKVHTLPHNSVLYVVEMVLR